MKREKEWERSLVREEERKSGNERKSDERQRKSGREKALERVSERKSARERECVCPHVFPFRQALLVIL